VQEQSQRPQSSALPDASDTASGKTKGAQSRRRLGDLPYEDQLDALQPQDAGGPLPFLSRIAPAFGQHDVSRIRVHQGPDAAAAATAQGANAVACGEEIFFAKPPTLALAAHEAAHVIQQRHGLIPSGGVGQAGDEYEQAAEEVARTVAAGRSAVPLLDGMIQGGGSPGVAIQRDEAQDKVDATALEDRDQGHSLKRHGPEVTDAKLQERLTTGYAPDGAFVPAPGLSTKFTSYDAYLKTRQAAATKITAAREKTVLSFKQLYAKLVEAKDALKTSTDNKAKAGLAKQLSQASGAIVTWSEGTRAGTTGELPVRFQKNAATPDKMLQFYGSYEVVVDHKQTIGMGYRGASPKQIPNPKKAGEQATVYDSTSKVDDISKTRTTYDLGKVHTQEDLPVAAAWPAVQHFPCDEAEGIFI
jgi:hypothetical protein